MPLTVELALAVPEPSKSVASVFKLDTPLHSPRTLESLADLGISLSDAESNLSDHSNPDVDMGNVALPQLTNRPSVSVSSEIETIAIPGRMDSSGSARPPCNIRGVQQQKKKGR